MQSSCEQTWWSTPAPSLWETWISNVLVSENFVHQDTSDTSKAAHRQTIKQTPKELLVIAKKIGLYDKTVFLLSKTKWKYSILLALAWITVNTSLDNFLYDVSNKLSELKKYIINNSFGKIYMPAINYMISFLNEMLSDWELTKKLQKGYQV